MTLGDTLVNDETEAEVKKLAEKLLDVDTSLLVKSWAMGKSRHFLT